MQDNTRERELERLSRLFLSSDEEKKEAPTPSEPAQGYSDLGKERLRVEEEVQTWRKITYPDIPPAQAELRRRLIKLLDEGYNILSVKLRRRTETVEQAKRAITEEEIHLGVKD